MKSSFFNRDVAIDLGTANTLVAIKGKGIVLNEPTVVAQHHQTGDIIAVGYEAKQMIGRSSGNIDVIRPMQEGVIADFETTSTMIQYFLNRVDAKGFWTKKPSVMICVPSGVTKVEKRAVWDAGKQAGAKDVFVITEPLAAALGAGLPVWEPTGNMIVDIGGGTTEVAIVSLGGLVTSRSIRIAGDYMDDQIQSYIRKQYSLAIGSATAELLKIKLGSAKYDDNRDKMDVRDRDIVTGLPETVSVSNHDMVTALQDTVQSIADAIMDTLEASPPELSADIMERGIVLTGGGALLSGLSSVVREMTAIPVILAEDPLYCVVRGTMGAIDQFSQLKHITNDVEMNM
ncbi:rod shape-determining protein MreB [Alkalibacillus flavidus]|uniref:Cell shape-determining protein MreB n=1 Tax=Alkalibacillus flavidus TaxID=546021 RepID=A0ABV2KSI6_9BACI